MSAKTSTAEAMQKKGIIREIWDEIEDEGFRRQEDAERGRPAGPDLITERIIIGCLLTHGPEAAEATGISPQDFAAPIHGDLWRWLIGHRDEWTANNAPTILKALSASGLTAKLDSPNSAAFEFLQAAEGVGVKAFKFHAGTFLSAAVTRRLREAAGMLAAGEITATMFSRIYAELSERRQESEKRSLREIMLGRLYDPDAPVPQPDYRLSIKGIPIMSAGNISTIVSLPKAGKSSVIVAAIAAGCGDGEYLGLSGDNKDRRPIIHLDTEQSKYHHDQKLRTISKRLGLDKLPSHVVSFRLTGERLGIENVRESIAIALDRNESKNPYLVLLDGGVDFLLSPNDEDASNAMIRDLMAVADEFDCVVLVSIHYNPGQPGTPNKSRGHYGSELERKSEAYLTINKDSETGHRSLFTKLTRERELPEGEAVRFAWDERAGMFNVLSDEVSGFSVENVLTILDREGALARQDLKKLLKENYGGDPRTWESRLRQAHKEWLVTTTGKPAKITLTKNGRCRLDTVVEREEDGCDSNPF